MASLYSALFLASIDFHYYDSLPGLVKT